jgi:DNA-binding winged helix-turn-helix (wHTH) protein
MTLQALRLEGCTVDLDRRQIRYPSRAGATLTEQEAGLLVYLAERSGRTVPRDELLERVWGYSTRAITRAIDVAVRRLRQKIELDPAAPRHVVAVRGVGYRFEPLPDDPSADPVVREPAPRSAAPTGVPRPRSSFVGRAPAVERLQALLGGPSRLVTVSGSPGIGKSRLAVQVAATRDVQTLYCPFGAVEDGGRWWAPIAEALALSWGPGSAGDPVSARREIGRRLGAALGARAPLLLVLDDADRVVAELADVAGDWLEAVPGLRILVTSRERLRIYGEAVVALDPLPPADGARLLLERAEAVRPGWGDADGGAATATDIARRLDGNPLAIELAAARAELLSPAALLGGLEEHLSLLERGVREEGGPADPQRKSLHAAIDWSWALLSDDERSTLAQCSVFEGGFTLASGAAVV